MRGSTYTELVEVLGVTRVEVEALRSENAALKVRVADLEARLRTNSQNSSKPPSTDGPQAPAPASLRRRSARKPGGQEGHPGQTLRQVPDPDVVIRHEPSCCRGCGAAADPRSVHLVDTRRFGRMIKASVALGGVVGACDGDLPVAAITSAVAELLEEGAGEIRAQVLPSLRRMVAEGMLTVNG